MDVPEDLKAVSLEIFQIGEYEVLTTNRVAVKKALAIGTSDSPLDSALELTSQHSVCYTWIA